MDSKETLYSLFTGTTLKSRGDAREIVIAAKHLVDQQTEERLAIYQDETGKVIDIDYRGSEEEVLARLSDHPILGEQISALEARGPGRPKLGVVSREVTLLPRHWEWLATQRGGASVTLRSLVDEARKREGGKAEIKRMQAALDRFLWDMASNFPDYEEATRALYASDLKAFEKWTSAWPKDVRNWALEKFKEWIQIQP